jgi:hypothetical protein
MVGDVLIADPLKVENLNQTLGQCHEMSVKNVQRPQVSGVGSLTESGHRINLLEDLIGLKTEDHTIRRGTRIVQRPPDLGLKIIRFGRGMRNLQRPLALGLTFDD